MLQLDGVNIFSARFGVAYNVYTPYAVAKVFTFHESIISNNKNHYISEGINWQKLFFRILLLFLYATRLLIIPDTYPVCEQSRFCSTYAFLLTMGLFRSWH